MSSVLWLTGLSGAGKSTIADLVKKDLDARGTTCCLLDGDIIRKGLSRDLAFSDAERSENVRRVAEVASLLRQSGQVVVVALISPMHADRELAKQIIGPEYFFEIFIDAPITLTEQRDVKGLYKKARLGLIPNFTGIDSPYQKPQAPALAVHTADESPTASAARVLDLLKSRAGI